jgi:hypothetical protein
MWFGPLERNILHSRENKVVLLKSDLARVSLSLPFSDPLNPLSTRSFYSSRLDSYIETQCLTGGPKVVKNLYNIYGFND